MPEGDVLRRTAATLGQALDGTELLRAELRWPRVDPSLFVGAVVESTTAYGKHLFHHTDSGWTLHTHLRMDGFWRLARAQTPKTREFERNSHVRVVLANERWMCAGFYLGMLDVVRTRDEHRLISHLGPDVLADDFVETGVPQAISRLRGGTNDGYRSATDPPLAEALLDQTIQAGIGTIYTAEPLFALRIWPWTPISQISDERYAEILLKARQLMQLVVNGGYEARISYVHDRRGKLCMRCRSIVQRGTARKQPMERPIFWCPTCQPQLSS